MTCTHISKNGVTLCRSVEGPHVDLSEVIGFNVKGTLKLLCYASPPLHEVDCRLCQENFVTSFVANGTYDPEQLAKLKMPWEPCAPVHG